MITVRSMLALVVALTLTACQSGGTASPAKKDPTKDAYASVEEELAKDYKPTPAFKTKVKDVMVSMTDRLLTSCMDAGSEANMQACFHERTLVGFDRDGSLRRQCKVQEDMGADFKCIFFGSMGDDLRARLTNEAVPYNWSKPEVSTHLIFRQLMLEQWRGCMDTGSASDPFDCFIARTTTALDLSTSDLEPCVPYKNDDETFGTCVGESYTYKYLKAGVARM